MAYELKGPGGVGIGYGSRTTKAPTLSLTDVPKPIYNGFKSIPSSGGGGGSVSITGDVTVTSLNAALYNGMVLEFTTAATVTLSAGLFVDFGFVVIPPASGNASIASAGGVLLNGATTTLTRTAASNTMFAVVQRDTSVNSYVVSGS